LIGGSWGIDPEVLKKADFILSFGPMTFPHGLARITLLEQIYRAKMIEAGSEYHK
jgi:23S rRNA (pseudouridine1915-N3)-methyltransferase